MKKAYANCGLWIVKQHYFMDAWWPLFYYSQALIAREEGNPSVLWYNKPSPYKVQELSPKSKFSLIIVVSLLLFVLSVCLLSPVVSVSNSVLTSLDDLILIHLNTLTQSHTNVSFLPFLYASSPSRHRNWSTTALPLGIFEEISPIEWIHLLP